MSRCIRPYSVYVNASWLILFRGDPQVFKWLSAKNHLTSNQQTKSRVL